jgi:hypothetical protein
MILDHESLPYANQNLDWFQTDSEELYQTNQINRPDDLEKFGWSNSQFNYQFNSAGFRSDEFDADAPGVVFLGCSHTVGVGLPAQETFARVVAAELNLRCYNLGVAGSANDTAFRLANYYIPRLNTKAVVFLSSDRTRFELFTQNRERHILSPTNHAREFLEVKDQVKGFYRYWVANQTNLDLHYEKNRLAIAHLCATNNIKFYHKEFLQFPCIDKARDLAHYGIISNFQIAKKILDTLK